LSDDEPATTRADGTVYLVGAGPGDPGLLTLRGGELLVTCDAIVYDALANRRCSRLPRRRSRSAGPSCTTWESAAARLNRPGRTRSTSMLVRLAREGKRVVRLKGGDRSSFGRGSEEAEALAREGLRFDGSTGVTAGIAAPRMLEFRSPIAVWRRPSPS
jgi:uroporphyrinogen III methyltransferase/synthase